MRTAPATTAHRIRATLQSGHPQGLADLDLEPTVVELADFETRMASLAGLNDQQIGARIGLPADLVPYFRQLMMTPVVTR